MTDFVTPHKIALSKISSVQKIAIKVDVEDKELLKIARTSMYSKLVSEDSPILSQNR
jgi:hypothetical protein